MTEETRSNKFRNYMWLEENERGTSYWAVGSFNCKIEIKSNGTYQKKKGVNGYKILQKIVGWEKNSFKKMKGAEWVAEWVHNLAENRGMRKKRSERTHVHWTKTWKSCGGRCGSMADPKACWGSGPSCPSRHRGGRWWHEPWPQRESRGENLVTNGGPKKKTKNWKSGVSEQFCWQIVESNHETINRRRASRKTTRYSSRLSYLLVPLWKLRRKTQTSNRTSNKEA